MKKRLITILSVAAVAIATVVTVALLMKKEYTEYLVVESDGVAISGDEMFRNLTEDKIEAENNLTFTGETFYTSDMIYERKGRLYLGENKIPLQTAYPFFVNNQSAVFCLTDSVVAVTEDFEYVSTYQGLYISNGISFNQDMERAYREDFIFLQLSNGLYMNAMDFTVKQSDLPGTVLTSNTVVSFFENEIRYYTPDGKGSFSFGRISGLNVDSKVQIDGSEYTYYDLLERLGLYEKEVLYDDVVATTLSPEPTPTAKVNPKVTLTPTAHVTKTPPTPGVTEDGADEPGTGEGIAGKLTPKPVPTLPGGATPTPQTKPTKVPTDRERVTSTPKPTMTPIPAPTAKPAAPGGSQGTVVEGEPAPTAAPAEPAAPEMPAEPAPPKPAKPSDPEAMIWVKPTAELNGSFSALVYSITHNSLEVTNPQFLHKSGITFEVLDPATGKLVTRKAYGGSTNDIRISGLRPGTKYKVVVTMNYVDVRGNKQSEVLRAGDIITTLGTDTLPPLSLNWSNGAYLYTNKAELVSIQIDNYNASNKLYMDMLQHIAKVEMQFSAKKSEESFKLDQKGLGKLKEQDAVDYTTPERLLSNREYTYTFVVTDKYGEAFRMEGTYSGKISTAKTAPTAKIKVIKNEVKDIEISVEITNEEKAATENMYFLVKNSNGSIVETAIYRNGVYEEKKDAHVLTEKSTTIRFDELIDFEVYTIEVHSDYDLSDNRGMQINQEIGKTKVVTASIASLGQAFYNVTVDPVTAETATVSLQLNQERTHQKLAAFIDEYDISFVKVIRDENGTVTGTSSEGIVVQYIAKEDASADDGISETLPEEQPGEGDGSEDENISGDNTDSGTVGVDEVPGEDGEGAPDDTEPPVSSDILFTKENGNTTLYEYQLDGIHGSGIRFMLSGLDSMSEYRIQIVPKVHVGNEEYGTVREIRTNFSPNSFKTLKQTPFVRIGSAYVTGNRIRLFDLSVVDEDGAVLEYPLSLQVYDENGYPVFRKNFSAGEVADGNKVKEIVVEPLNRFKKYTFRFFVTRYNDVPDSADYSTNYELYYEPYVKTKELLVLETGEAVLGNLNFIGMNTYKVKDHSELEVLTGAKGTKDLFTPYAVRKSPTGAYITSTSEINKVSYTSKGTTAAPFKRYDPPQNTWSVVYKATIDFGTGEYNSMSVGYSHSSGGYPLAIRLYTEDPTTVNSSAVPVAETTLDGKGKTFNNYAIKWLDAAKFKDGAAPLTGEQTVYVEYVGTDTSKYAWIGAFSGVIFRNIEEVSSDEKLYANLSVDVNDVRGQLGSMAAYRIKVYKDGVLDDMQEHVYTSLNGVPEKAVYLYDILHEDGQAPQYLEAISYTADDKQCITDFFYEVDRNAAKGHVYEMVLTAIVDGYEITLDRITFESKDVVHGIRNREEFSLLCWDTKASYVALNDIDFGTWSWSNTGLTSGVFFEGHLDFQGYKMIVNNIYAPFYNIGTNGVVENIVITHAESFVGNSTAVLVYNNYGTIRNVVYERNSTNATLSYQNKYGLVTFNRHSGIVENFVVHFKDDWYVGQYAGAITYINWGIIRNGYVYGNPIKYVPKEYMDATQQSQSNYIGAIAAVNRVGGTIENCFTVMDIYSSMPYRTSDHMTFFAGSNRGLVRNCFSSGSVYYKESYGDGYIIKNTVSPLCFKESSGGISEAKELYLYSGESYDKTTLADILLEKAALHDKEWYDELLNDASATTKAGEIDTNPVRQGFYPHVNMAAGMPEQPWLLLPELTTYEKPDIIFTEVVEQGMDYAIGELTLYNPEKTPVQFVSIEHFAAENVEILNQYDAEDFWHVRFRVTKPEKCFSEYNILGFEMGSARDLISYSRYYAEYEYKKIGFEFYNAISNIADWLKINDDRTQNYRLYNDIDFAYYPMEAVYIGNGKAPVATAASNWATYAYNFTGTFDGNGKTISNLDLRQYGGLFESLYGGTVKNLTIKNVDISALDPENPVNLRRAVIRTIGKDSVVENVHVLGVTITGTEVSGGLVAMMHAGRNTIVNCSVHDATITTTSKNNGNTQYIGGIAGIGSGEVIISITNSYVDGLHITARDASDVGGIGGIVGRVTAGCTLENLYVTDSVIDSFFQYTGGVAGSIINQTYSDGYVLQNVYIDADISSVSDLMGGLVAYSQPVNQADKVNALFLGNIFMRNEEFNYVSRYIGYQTATTNLVKDGLYTFKEMSYVNGRLNNEDRDDTDTRNKKDPYVYLTRDDLCNPEFYTNGIKVDGVYRNLDIGEGFALTYDVTDGDGAVIGTTTYAENEQLPWLRSADGKSVLPYQKFHTFEETDVQITKITAAAKTSNAELFEVKVTVSHPENYNVEALHFDSNVSIASGPHITKGSANESVIAYEVLAQGYVDRYYITGIDGKVNETEELQIALNLDSMIPALFLDINNADDWNTKMVQHGQKGYNIRINGNLDFTGQSDYQENVIVNRVLGGFVEEANWVKITGINRITYEPLIATSYGRISNIKFEHITLEKQGKSEAKRKNFGIIGHAAGNVSNVHFTDITIDSSYADTHSQGGYANNVAPICMLSGAISNVKINGVDVRADATGTTSTNTTAGLVGYANTTASFANIEAKNISILSGDRWYTGGIVGYMSGATKLTGISISNFSISANTEAGGVAGRATDSTYGRTVNSISVKDGIIVGDVRVGGAMGYGYLVNSSDSLPTVIDNVLVIGGKNCIGGAVGQGGASRNVTVKDSKVYGNYYVGGIVGNGNALATHCVDSTISSVWSRTDDATTNNLYQKMVTDRKEVVSERIEDSSTDALEKRMLVAENKILDALLVTDSKKKDWRYLIYNQYTGVPSKNNRTQDSCIGGISGRGQLFESNVVTNCTIGSITAEEVGGIVGHHVNVGYDTWSRTARVFSNACTDSKVTGATDVGGIIGIAKRYVSSNNYSNATVSAVAPSKVDITGEGTNAGGIIGCINKTATYALSETPRVYSCYFAGTVSANDYVGGIIGRCYQDVYGDNRDLMMTGTVCVTSDIVNPHIQLIANRIANPTGAFVESVVYKDAKLVYGTAQREQTAEQYYKGTEADGATGLTPTQQMNVDNVSMVSTSDLQNKDFWSKKSGSVQVGFTTSPNYWNFDGLINGYMPYVSYYLFYNSDTSKGGVARYQEGFTVDANGVKTYNYKTYNGGVSIPGYVSGRSLMMMRKPVVQETELPTMTAYCTDADKLNLEFSSVNPAASYVVSANGETLTEGTVTSRVITLQYDYKTTLLVTVTEGAKECEYRINAVDVSRNVMVSGDEYFYITGNGVEGSRATITGNFVNLYKGKALTIDGMLYDVTTGNLIGKAKNNGVADTVVPLAQFTYDGYMIELYHGFTVSAGLERNNKRLYVKDNTLFAIDSALSKEADAVILETEVGLSQLTAILEHGGSIAELTDENLCLPKDFVNNRIAQMTNNLDTDSSIMLVRYKDGGVMGFDYLSGTVLFQSLRTGAGNAQGGNSATGSSLITNAADSYKEIQAFENGLIASGWSPANGTSAANGTSGSLTGNTSVPENGSDANGDALGGGSGGTSGDTKTEGGFTGTGTNEVSGDATQSGSHTGDGTNVDSGDGVLSSGGGQISGTEQTGVTPAVTNTPGTETGVQNGKTEVSDTSSPDVSGDALQTDKTGAGATGGKPGTAGSTGSGSVTGTGEAFQNQYSEIRGNGSVYGGGSEEKKYVPFFDSELNEYVLFDEAELLAVADTSLTSMNEKVKLSGHMIDRYIPYRNDANQMDDDDRNGMVLMFLTIAGVAILLGILIYKHQNGGKANEED